MIEDYDDEELTLDEQMAEAYGGRWSWLADKEKIEEFDFTDEYRAFLNNDCLGLLTYEQAVEAYKGNCGELPEFVTEWPSLDWVKQKREEVEREFVPSPLTPDLDEFLRKHLPYEPMLKFRY